MAEAPTHIARAVQLTLNKGAGGEVTLSGKMHRIQIMPEDREQDVETFDEPGATEYGQPRWGIEIDVRQRHGDGGVTNEGLEMLEALQRQRVTFDYEAEKGVGPTPAAPHYTGSCNVPTIPIVNAEVGGTSEFTLTLPVVGEPTKVTS